MLLYPGWSKSWQMAAVIRIKISIWENFSWIREGGWGEEGVEWDEKRVVRAG